MTDGVTVDIIWIKGTRMPWFDIRLGHLKKKKLIVCTSCMYELHVLVVYMY